MWYSLIGRLYEIMRRWYVIDVTSTPKKKNNSLLRQRRLRKWPNRPIN